MDSQQPRVGIFVSYNEKKNGKFQDAVDVCNDHEYVIWFETKNVKTQRFLCPTTILIRITGEDRYYRGELREIKHTKEITWNAVLAEADHRPAMWKKRDKSDYAGCKSVFRIAGLKQVPRPAGIAKDRAPQGPHYIEEIILQDLREPIVPLSEEVLSTGKLTEGAVCRVTVNAYERNPVARSRCIGHYGPTCIVCRFNFGAVYGLFAERFIHVHHIKPLSEVGEEYEVDPIADLRPVCANCHAIIHLGGKCRDIEEARCLVHPRVREFWTSFTKQGA